jgi:hypothetical protein
MNESMDQSPHPFGEYAAIVSTMARHGVEFVICGGVAATFYGVPRNTQDIDLLVRMTNDNLEKLVRAVRELKMQPRIPEPLEALLDSRKRQQWVEQKQSLVYTLVSPKSPLQIDVFLKYPIPFDEAWTNARIGEVDGHEFRLTSIPDLLRAKKLVQPPRDTDVFDIRHLERMISHGPSRQ